MSAETSQDATTVRILRRGIGIVGLTLPFAVTLGSLAFGRGLPGSLSSTYYTEMRNIFVGGLWAVGIFLICYRNGRTDDRVGWIAGLLAIMVAIFPTTPNRLTTEVSSADKWIGAIHYISAALLFVMLAVFCLFLFPRTQAQKATRKYLRHRIYRVCGYVIVAAMILAGLSNLLPTAAYDRLKPLLICEAIAVLAFGIAWLVKGETILRDTDTVQPGSKTDPGGAPDLPTESAPVPA